MADFGGIFGHAFGGDFANSFAKGMQIGMMQRQMEMQEKKMQQDYELNHLLREEQTLKVRAQRNALEEANKYKQQWEALKEPGQATIQTSPEGYDFSAGEPVPAQTQTIQTPSKMQQMFPGKIGQILEMGGPDMMKTIAPKLIEEGMGGKPVSDIGKLQYDRQQAISRGYPENHPYIQAIDRKIGQVDKAPTVHTFTEGDKTVEKQWNPETGAWDVVSSGPRYKPPQAAQNYDKNILIAAQAAGIDPEKVKSGNLTQDEAIKVADSYSKRFGTQSLIQLLTSGGIGGGKPSTQYDNKGNLVK